MLQAVPVFLGDRRSRGIGEHITILGMYEFKQPLETFDFLDRHQTEDFVELQRSVDMPGVDVPKVMSEPGNPLRGDQA